MACARKKIMPVLAALIMAAFCMPAWARGPSERPARLSSSSRRSVASRRLQRTRAPRVDPRPAVTPASLPNAEQRALPSTASTTSRIAQLRRSTASARTRPSITPAPSAASGPVAVTARPTRTLSPAVAASAAPQTTRAVKSRLASLRSRHAAPADRDSRRLTTSTRTIRPTVRERYRSDSAERPPAVDVRRSLPDPVSKRRITTRSVAPPVTSRKSLTVRTRSLPGEGGLSNPVNRPVKTPLTIRPDTVTATRRRTSSTRFTRTATRPAASPSPSTQTPLALHVSQSLRSLHSDYSARRAVAIRDYHRYHYGRHGDRDDDRWSIDFNWRFGWRPEPQPVLLPPTTFRFQYGSPYWNAVYPFRPTIETPVTYAIRRHPSRSRHFRVSYCDDNWYLSLFWSRPYRYYYITDTVYVPSPVARTYVYYQPQPAVEPLSAPDGIDSLVLKLKYKDVESRREAARMLGMPGNLRAVYALIYALEYDEDPLVRYYAAESLGEIGSRDAYEPLTRVAKEDPEEAVRAAAANAAGFLIR